MKKVFYVLLMLSLLATSLTIVWGVESSRTKVIEISDEQVPIYFDGKKVETPSFLYEGRTYIPLRAYAESADMQVDWEEETRSVHVQSNVLPELDIYSVSLINLIANPKQFHGKKVSATGWVRLEFESTMIYLTEADYEKYNRENGIRIDNGKYWNDEKEEYSNNALNGKYCIIKGIFEFDEDYWFQIGGAAGRITDVERLEEFGAFLRNRNE